MLNIQLAEISTKVIFSEKVPFFKIDPGWWWWCKGCRPACLATVLKCLTFLIRNVGARGQDSISFSVPANLFVHGHVMALKVESRPVEACAWIEIQGAMCIRVPQIDQFVWILVFCLNSCFWFMVYGLLNPFIVLHCNYKQWGYQAKMRFSHNFWLGAPIDTWSTRLNCILQGSFSIQKFILQILGTLNRAFWSWNRYKIVIFWFGSATLPLQCN